MTDPTPRADPDELLAEAGWIRSRARSLAGDSARAADLEQETWRVALERPPRADGGRAGLRGPRRSGAGAGMVSRFLIGLLEAGGSAWLEGVVADGTEVTLRLPARP